MKILNVAEKNDAAKNLANIMARGRANRREGKSPYNKIYEYDYILFNTQCKMLMTSVSGHLLDTEFTGQYRKWHSCPPLSLFQCPVEHFVPDNYKKIEQTLRQEAKGAKKLIIWTDCDREGENIGFEIINVVRAVTPRIEVLRARFSEITGPSINRALANLVPPDKRASDAVEVRRELDLRIGAAYTRFLTMRYQVAFPEVLRELIVSYGGCQFPTLGFVVERYKQIQQFIPEPFWKIQVRINEDDTSVLFNWARVRLFDYSITRSIYEICINDPIATVTDVRQKPKSKWRPQALDTVEFEKSICRRLKVSAKEAMTSAERLYTGGAISYPRTETNIFPKELDLRPLVQHQTGDPNWGEFAGRLLEEGITPRNGKKSDQAHPPIHPTKYTNTFREPLDKKVYEFIVRHFLACCSKDAKGSETMNEINIAGEKFSAAGLLILERNYLDVYPYENWTDKPMPYFKTGDRYQPQSIQLTAGETSAPQLLTEADLIALMEKHQIGTDATHAEHIEKIKTRHYVGVVDGRFLPGQLGMALIEGYDALGFEFSKPRLRAALEDDLKKICEGTKQPEIVLADQIKKYRDLFEVSINNVASIDEQMRKYLGNMNDVPDQTLNAMTQQNPVISKCPTCGSDLVLKTKHNQNEENTALPQTEHVQSYNNKARRYISCMGYPACRCVMWLPSDMNDISVTDSNCNRCGGDTKKVQIKFRCGSVPPSLDEEYEGCLLCDPLIKQSFNLRLQITANNPTNRSQRGGTTTNQSQRGRATTNRSQRGGTTANQSQRGRATMNQSQRGGTTNSQSQRGRTTTNQSQRGVSKTNQSQRPPPLNNTAQYGNYPTAGSSLGLVSQAGTNQSRRNVGSEGKTPLNDQTNNMTVCMCNEPALELTVRKDGPNQGRKFFKCGKDNKCNFFAWADNAEPANQNRGNHRTGSDLGASTSYHTGNHGEASTSYQTGNGDDDSLIINCNCNLPSKRATVRKEGGNQGREFFCCIKPREEGCGFFQWADQPPNSTSPRGGGGASRAAYRGANSSTRGASTGEAKRGTKRKCGHCREEGHNKKSCPRLK